MNVTKLIIIVPIIIHITTFKNLLVGYFTLPIIIIMIPERGHNPDKVEKLSLTVTGKIRKINAINTDPAKYNARDIIPNIFPFESSTLLA